VREYFEGMGFMVVQPCKYAIPGRQKQPEEEMDLLILNPRDVEHAVPEGFVRSTSDLRNVKAAVVGVRGWHTERFYLSKMEQTPEIWRFADQSTLDVASRILGTRQLARILCLPRLPASGELKRQTIEFLRSRGVDGVLPFRTILMELLTRVDAHRNYEKSDVLQILRMLKSYDLIKYDQMELFEKKHTKARQRRSTLSSSTAVVGLPGDSDSQAGS
jgi:hypothetical protein